MDIYYAPVHCQCVPLTSDLCSEEEAWHMLGLMRELLVEGKSLEQVFQQRQDQEPQQGKPHPLHKKSKSLRRFNKKDISSPCNFKHVSGTGSQLWGQVSGTRIYMFRAF